MNQLDKVADALRLKDAEQRGTDILAWRWITDTERSKWRELAMVAAANFATSDGGATA